MLMNGPDHLTGYVIGKRSDIKGREMIVGIKMLADLSVERMIDSAVKRMWGDMR